MTDRSADGTRFRTAPRNDVSNFTKLRGYDHDTGRRSECFNSLKFQ